MPKHTEKPAISGGRTLSRDRKGNKNSSESKKRSKRAYWGRLNDVTYPTESSQRLDRAGIAGKNVRPRKLVCGHTVMMLACQRPLPDTYCIQCLAKPISAPVSTPIEVRKKK